MSQILWAGTDTGFDEYIKASEKFSAVSQKDFEAMFGNDTSSESSEKENPLPRLLSVYGGVGVISIHGVLTDTDNWWNKYAGLVSYSEIREAVVTALTLPDVVELMAYVKSPGGVVSGLKDTHDFMKSAQKIKPVTMFSDSMVASAAMWISAPAERKRISADALAGSIGVVMKHTEYTEMLKKDGVKVTTIRAGEFKQLANATEKLSDKAKSEAQKQVDYLYQVFVQDIADDYKMSYQSVDKRLANGVEFIGKQAVDAGLIGKLSSFDGVLQEMQLRIKKSDNKTGGFNMKKKYAITAEALAALSAGASISDLNIEDLNDVEAGSNEGVSTDANSAEGVSTEASSEDNSAEGVSIEASLEGNSAEGASTDANSAEGVSTEASTEASTRSSSEANSAEGASDAVSVLTAQLKEKDDLLFDAKVALKGATEKVDVFAETETLMKATIASAINRLVPSVGGSIIEDSSNVDAKTLVNTYDASITKLEKMYPVGGTAKVDADAEATVKPLKLSRLSRAGLRAVK